MIWLLLACQQATEVPATGPLKTCAPYQENTSVYGYCLSHEVTKVRTVDGMVAICTLVPEWEGRCRHAWVFEQRRSRRTKDSADLLEDCAADVDCAFEQIESSPIKDPLQRIALCQKHVAPYFDDCAVHALNMWVQNSPTVAEADQLQAILTEHPEVLGAYLAKASFCKNPEIKCGEGQDAASNTCRALLQNAGPSMCAAPLPAALTAPPAAPPSSGPLPPLPRSAP